MIHSRRWLRSATVAGLVLQAGCATITRGTTDEVWFESDPAGARVHLQPSTIDCVTPCAQELTRKREYLVFFEKEGYEPAQVRLTPKFVGAGAAGFAGNVLLGGVVGMGVDQITGASKVLRPNPVKVTLVPVTTPPVPLPARAAVAELTVTPTAVSTPAADATPDASVLQTTPPPASLAVSCIQPALVDREICLGRLRLGMTKSDAIALLGTPDGTSRDQMTFRYGDRYLKFDAADVVAAIGDKP